MVLGRIDVVLWLIEIWGNRGDKFRASRVEELLEDGEGIKTTALHTLELVAVFLAEGCVDGVVETSRAEGDADGDQSVHLVVLLSDRVELGVLLEVLCS